MAEKVGTVEVWLKVNGERRETKVEPRDTLLDTLRDNIGLTGVKKGCDEAVCGACSVLLNGKPVCSCMIFALEAAGSDVVTVEGLATSSEDRNMIDPIQRAFIEADAQQCGFCTGGQLISAKGLLSRLRPGSRISDDEIKEALAGNLCRCGCYNNIVEAVKQVATSNGVITE